MKIGFRKIGAVQVLKIDKAASWSFYEHIARIESETWREKGSNGDDNYMKQRQSKESKYKDRVMTVSSSPSPAKLYNSRDEFVGCYFAS